MLNISFVLFCWQLPSIPSPPRRRSHDQGFFPLFLKMADVVETEALSFLKQEITHRLIIVAHCQN